MKNKPLVTVYIPCHNYGKYLSMAIESVINQIYEEWELIIIDEASNDDTEKISKSFQKKHPKKIKFVKNAKPLGLQKVANKILSMANGKYMIRLDADDWFNEAALYILVQNLEKNSKVGIIYGNYFYTDILGNILGIEMRHKLGKDDLVGQLPPHGACTLFRTNDLKEAGGYLENVDAQDGWDLWYKLYKKVGAMSIDLPIFYYRQHDESLSRDSDRLLNARVKIFEELRDKTYSQSNPNVLGIIPVKESYPNLKDVPYRTINGCSLLEIAISNALKSKQINNLVVSSESQKVLDFSKKLEEQNKVPSHLRLLRKKGTYSKYIPITEFMKSAGNNYIKKFGKTPDVIIYLSLHAINRRRKHIDNALNNLIISESETVVSVQEEREPMFNYGKSGLELINPGRFLNLSFDRERLFRFNGSIIASRWENILSDKLFGVKTSFIEMSQNDSIQVKDETLFDKL